MAQNFYWTNDWSDSGSAMREDCVMTRVTTEDEAREAARADMAASTDLEEGERIIVEAIGESDCWAKVPREWTPEEIAEYAAEKGIDPADISVRRPGEHPGGGWLAWVSVTAWVFGARVEAA